MFYSHEILTSRKYGVATVWLVATLGAKSNLKKINRKAILDVDVPKACDTIIRPEAPMALRLQSNLLFGVSRVYSQQCGYVLVDAQTAQANMKALLRIVKDSELDLDAGKARPEQLVLQDDPAFLPDFFLPTLDFDIPLIGSSTQGSSKRESDLSTQIHPSSQSSHKEAEGSFVDLAIPSSSGSGGAGGIGGFQLYDAGDDLHMDEPVIPDDILGEVGFDPNVGFNFDEIGNLQEMDPMHQTPARPSEVIVGRDVSESALRTRVGPELEPGAMDLDENANDFALLGAGDHNVIQELPDAAPFPAMHRRSSVQASSYKSSTHTEDEESEEDSSSSAQAPVRRRVRRRKPLPLDEDFQEVLNAQLSAWNNNYLQNMAADTRIKMQNRQISQAKKNAAIWVFGNGINGIGSKFGGSSSVLLAINPLSMFSGDALRQALTGIRITTAGQKHARTEEPEGEEDLADSEGRRTRPRSDEDGSQELGRGDDGFTIEESAIELPRAHSLIAEEISTEMPWNRSSIRGSSHPGSVTHGDSRAGSRARSAPGSRVRSSSIQDLGALGFSSSVGRGFSSAHGAVGLERRASRMGGSASPLVGRSTGAFPTGDEFGDLQGLGAEEEEDREEGGIALPIDEQGSQFQLFGPAAGVSTQTAQESHWVKGALQQESLNFLEFVRAEVGSRRGEEEGADGEDEEGALRGNMILFGDLLPPTRYSRIVAAQAFLHVLVLASRGLVEARQREKGDIWVGVREVV